MVTLKSLPNHWNDFLVIIKVELLSLKYHEMLLRITQ